MLDWPAFQSRFLPLPPAHLDPLRAMHRRLLGRPSELSFESTLNREISNGRMRHVILPGTLGSSLHVFRAEDAADLRFPSVIARWENGEIPQSQLESGWEWNYCRDSWLVPNCAENAANQPRQRKGSLLFSQEPAATPRHEL